jgi:bacterioferritin
MFQREVMDELGHASFLNDVIADLGGEPTTMPKHRRRPRVSGRCSNWTSRWSCRTLQTTRESERQAEALGEAELKVKLEEMAADEAGHARELRRLLKGL